MPELKDYLKKHKVSIINVLFIFCKNSPIINLHIDELVKQKVKEQEEAKTESAKDADEDEMNVDEPVKDDKKVSTSGYRTARHHLYKKNKKKSNNVSFKKKK